MSFGDGNLHDKYADVFKAMGMDVPDGFTRERHDRLIEGITRCRSMNAANVAEINRQERRIRQLEQLVRDLCEAWDDDEGGPWVSERLAALGIEVD